MLYVLWFFDHFARKGMRLQFLILGVVFLQGGLLIALYLFYSLRRYCKFLDGDISELENVMGTPGKRCLFFLTVFLSMETSYMEK